MKSTKRVGRIIGIMLLIQLTGLIVPFVLLHPMTNSDFLTNAAISSAQIKTAVMLLLANCALTIGISFAAFRMFRQYNSVLAVLLIILSAMMFLLQAVDNAHLMAMLLLSQEYVKGGGSEEIFQTLSAVVRSTRRWSHYSELLVIDAWIYVLYSLLYRFALMPRTLAILGLSTVLLHFAAIPLPLILGYSSVTPLGVPMAISHITLAIWLMAKPISTKPALSPSIRNK